MKLAGAHAVVTGGGTGIGAAIARALAAEGTRVSLLGRRIEPLASVAEEINAFFTICDVTRAEKVELALAAARARHGEISILINNAGAASSAPFAMISIDDWRNTLAINLDGVFHCSHAVAQPMSEAGQGRIVTIASTAGLHGYAYTAPYCAAKHGAVGLMRALAAEFEGKGVTANAVCPGFVDTEIVAEAVRNIVARTGRSETQARADLAAMNPSGRLIAPEVVARIVIELIRTERTGEAVEIA